MRYDSEYNRMHLIDEDTWSDEWTLDRNGNMTLRDEIEERSIMPDEERI